MSRVRELLNILLVAAVIGGALGTIFVQLIQFEIVSRNREAELIWIIEWVVFTLLLTAFLCRQEIRSLFRPGPPQ